MKYGKYGYNKRIYAQMAGMTVTVDFHEITPAQHL